MTATTTVRVSRELYNTLKSLSIQEHENMQSILETAVNDYKKKKFYEEMNNAISV